MAESQEIVRQPFNGVKWLIVFALVAGGVWGNFHYTDESLLYRVLGLIAITAVAIAVALQTSQGVMFWNIAKGARTEIRKVVWPTHQETVQTTLIVMVFVVITALILWGLDALLGWLSSLTIV